MKSSKPLERAYNLCSNIKTSQLICIVNELNGFYIVEILALNGLTHA